MPADVCAQRTTRCHDVGKGNRRAPRRRLPAPSSGETALGLPATSSSPPDGVVLAAKYGKRASDQWSVDELLRLAAERA
ncbi:hypothetical protein ACFSTC_38150 [Nonomuraea ferruginea]